MEDFSEIVRLKEEGNNLFKQKEYQKAIACYQQGLSILLAKDLIHIQNEEEPEEEASTVEDPIDLSKHNDFDAIPEQQEETKQEDKTEVVEEFKTPIVLSEEEKTKRELEVILRSNSAACYLEMEHFERAVQECSKAISIDSKHTKSLYRRIKANEKLENYDQIITDIKSMEEITNGTSEYEMVKKLLLPQLPKFEDLRKKKMEVEMQKMWGQLKDLGNSVLGAFGLNLDNFKFNKDPASGNYNVSFGNK